MKKWVLLLVGAILATFAVVGFMYSQGADVVDDDVMYMVSHSEYWSGEEGQIIARLYNWAGNPITVDNCTVDIYYPDKTLFKTGELTDDSLQATTGTHYYNFTTPAIEGVYQYYATCNYNSKSRTVANSFHLSPPLNFLLTINNSITLLTAQELAHYITVTDNLTTIRDELGVVDGNVDQVLLNQIGMNGTLNGMNGSLEQILLNQIGINGSISSIETTVNTISGNVDEILINITTIDGNLDIVLLNLTTIRTELGVVDANVDQLLLDVASVQTDTTQLLLDVASVQTDTTQLLLDVADVQTDTTYIRSNMMTQDNITIITDGQANILSNLTAIQGFCDDPVTNSSQLCVWVSAINDQVIEINTTLGANDALIAEINATTHSTYDYLTGTVTTTINNIFGVSTQINGTVNRIETTVGDINSTVNALGANVSTVITNQEDVVYMEVTS